MKAILTALGKDKPGIIAAVSSLLATHQVNVEDISQTVMHGNFTMVMLINLSESALSIAELSEKFSLLAQEVGVEISLRHEDIFNAMHKI
jgi:ACT domain-containing protein